MKNNASVQVASWRSTYFTWIALVVLLIVFTGFARTYYLKSFFGTPALPTLLHLHGAILTLWFTLFLVQVRLVAVHRVDLHRLLGTFGAMLAVLVLWVSSAVAIRATRRDYLADPHSDAALSFLAFLLLGELLSFACFVALALLLRRRPEIHKRLMLLGSCCLLGAPVIRIPLHFIQTLNVWAIFGTIDSIPMVFILYDTIRNRRLHPAFLWGGIPFVLVNPTLTFFSKTAVWIHFARWLVV
ncbi:MAG: hypothetical protein WA765_04755 [Candidatus Acidiferrum sp.]